MLLEKDVVERVACSIHDINDAWIQVYVLAVAAFHVIAKEAIEVARAFDRVMRDDSQGRFISHTVRLL
jgi:hypothetical protein